MTSVIHARIADEPPEHRLAQQTGQPMATVLTGARIGKSVGPDVSQSQGAYSQ